MEEFELESGEEIIMMVRQHPFVLALRLIPLAILFFLPWFASGLFSLLLNTIGAQTGNISFPSSVFTFLNGLWMLGVWTTAFGIITRYYLTVWVITNIRIVDIKQWGFFNRQVSSFLLVRVQDMTTDISGVLATLVGFGSLGVETAGKDEQFRMSGISRPERVRDVIMAQVAQLHHSDTLSGV
jgi:hypothetical protein